MTTEKELLLRGWQFADNSGDGGDFGFHMKPLHGGLYVIGMSTGGIGTSEDYIYPVTRFKKAADVMLTMYQAKDRLLPVTPAEFLDRDVSDAMQWEAVFPDVASALAVVDWLTANLKDLSSIAEAEAEAHDAAMEEGTRYERAFGDRGDVD